MNTNDVVDESREETGLTVKDEDKGILTQAQHEKYEQLLMVCDRNVNLDGRSNNHNMDFSLIKDKRGGEHIEPTRNFCLKAVSVFGCSYEPVGEPTIVQLDGEILVSRDVKVMVNGRHVTETGGCSTKETSASGARAFHDASARAMTRATKRGLEALVGLPFVNMMIKELFGRYQVKETNRNVTPRKKPDPKEAPEAVKKLGREIYKALSDATKEGYLSIKERNSLWTKTQLAMTDYNQLVKEKKVISELIEERGGQPI